MYAACNAACLASSMISLGSAVFRFLPLLLMKNGNDLGEVGDELAIVFGVSSVSSCCRTSEGAVLVMPLCAISDISSSHGVVDGGILTDIFASFTIKDKAVCYIFCDVSLLARETVVSNAD